MHDRRAAADADEWAVRMVDAGSEPARVAMSRYFAELDARFPTGFRASTSLDDAAAYFNPPNGAFVVAARDDAVLGCAAVQFLDDDRGEIKRMWVAPDARARGVATRLLSYLEELVRASGRETVLLDTNGTLTEAVALYTKNGYRPTERYNDNPYADHWFVKTLR